ncbi:MAG TPA: hypothetical protein VGM38_09355 [Pseudolysinimonas sp.]|jgi:hypothetical protein
MIDVINRVADEPDPTSRVRMLIKLLRTSVPDVTYQQDAFLAEMDEKAAFIASAIVSGGHVHEMSMTFHGVASGG